MDHLFTARIQQFLQLKKPTDTQIVEGATMLLQLSPARYRAIYNSAVLRPQSMLPWVRTELKKHQGIRKRGLMVAQVEDYNREVVKQVEETLSTVPSTLQVEKEANVRVVVLGQRGKRSDHEQLPENIRKIWDVNEKRWVQLSRLHYQLAQMIAKPGYAACDGNELCFQMRQIDDALRSSYATYDDYQLSTTSETPDSAPDQIKTVQNARTAISRGLSRKTQDEESLSKLQDAVNTLFALKQTVKTATVSKLKALGIVIPNEQTNAEG